MNNLRVVLSADISREQAAYIMKELNDLALQSQASNGSVCGLLLALKNRIALANEHAKLLDKLGKLQIVRECSSCGRDLQDYEVEETLREMAYNNFLETLLSSQPCPTKIHFDCCGGGYPSAVLHWELA